MDKFIVERNGQQIGEFVTYNDRKNEEFLEEFYAMLMPLIPDAGEENLRNKVWSELDKDLDFDINDNHYLIKLTEEKP